MANAMTLVVNADTSSAQGEMKALGKSVGGVGDETGKTSARTKVMAGVLFDLVRGTAAAMKATIDYGDWLEKTAQKTGISTEALSAWKLGAELAGTSQKALVGGLQKLQKQMGSALRSPTSAAALAFKNLGVEFQNADGSLRNVEALLPDLADAMAGMEDGTLKTGAAMDLMGRAGADLIPFLNQGADGIHEMTEEARAMGIVMSQDDAEAAAAFNDALAKLKATFDGLIVTAALAYLPTFLDIAEGMVLATQAILGLTEAEDEREIRNVSQAQTAIMAKAEAVTAIRMLIAAEEENIKWAEASGLSAEGFRINIARLSVELEHARGVSKRTTEELGEQAGVLTEQIRLRREEARLRAEAGTGDRTPAGAKTETGDDGVKAVMVARTEAVRDLERSLDSMAAVMVKTEEASLQGVDRLTFRLEQERAAIELQRDALLASEMLSLEETYALRVAASDAIVALEEETDRRIAEINATAMERERSDSQERIRLKDEATQSSLRSAATTVAAVGEFAGATGDLIVALYGEQTKEGKKAAKVAFVVQQAFGLGVATISMFAAIGQAAASAPPPANVPAIIAATAIGAAQIIGIAATTIVGVADAGMMPGTLAKMGLAGSHSALLVRDDELVADPGTTEQLGRTVALTNQILASGGAGLGGSFNITVQSVLDGEMVSQSTERRRVRNSERGIPADRSIRF